MSIPLFVAYLWLIYHSCDIRIRRGSMGRTRPLVQLCRLPLVPRDILSYVVVVFSALASPCSGTSFGGIVEWFVFQRSSNASITTRGGPWMSSTFGRGHPWCVSACEAQSWYYIVSCMKPMAICDGCLAGTTG